MSIHAPRQQRTFPQAWRSLRVALIGASLLLLAGCDGSPSALEPKGPNASNIATLWWWMLALATAVAVLTFTLLGIALWRARQDTPLEKPLGMDGHRFTLLAGAVIPAAILIFVTVLSLNAMVDIDSPPAETTHVVEVIGWMWWWEVRYPETGAITANEIHIPAGEPVELRLTAADVIHAFWAPELHGKMDLMPGKENSIWIQADEPGVYRGQCAEFCGLQHTFMAKLIIAHEPEEYQAWLARESEPAREPQTARQERGRDVFMEQQCHFCHSIRGTDARGDVGPDLTHIMSRQTLGAATIDNTIGHLAAWVMDPHLFKPGVKMPEVHFAGEDFEALIDYLVSLE